MIKKEFCGRNPYFSGFFLAIKGVDYLISYLDIVAILILVDFSLQFLNWILEEEVKFCRNPYFSGFFLAILREYKIKEALKLSQSLF